MDAGIDADTKKKEDLEAAIDDWREHFPATVSRAGAPCVQKTVVMRYVDNLTGDKLFRRTPLSRLARLLSSTSWPICFGYDRVPPVEETGAPPARRCENTRRFSNGVVQVEALIPFSSGAGGNGTSGETKNILAAQSRLLHPIQRQAARLLGYSRRPAFQDPQLHEH
jgi:hypothetical protein